MATLTVRQPATAADRAARQAAWARRGGAAARPVELPRRSTPVWSDLYTLQPPTGQQSIALAPLAAAQTDTPADAAAADNATAAGWFDSTWDLQQGLEVAEGLPVDVPLEAWLQVYLNA